MTEQYEATFEEWASIETRDTTIISCLLELRARVEALEATQHAHVDLSGVPESERQQMLDSLRTPARIELLPLEQDRPQVVTPDAPAGSLVERNPECVASWPDCYEGGYDPRCCRFPKSCSCEVRQEVPEPATTPPPASSLVERVADSLCCDPDLHGKARAAIREVATWLALNGWVYASDTLLRQEVLPND
jgi:hypothetical protein